MPRRWEGAPLKAERALRAAEGWLELNAPKLAWEELDQLADQEQASVAVFSMRTRIFVEARGAVDGDTAASALRKIMPTMAKVHFHLARLSASLGWIKEAREQVDLAAKLDPGLSRVMRACDELAALW